jgi:CDP-6-deoxy-D-xylo-4-hexulose-3-dehydrase
MTKDLEIIKNEILQKVLEYGKLKYSDNKFIPGETLIPPSGKILDFNELSFMVDASLDGWLTAGEFNTKFEKKLANFIGVNHLITTNSGSSANLLAFSTLTSPLLGERKVNPGDEVITVAAGFPTTINPAILHGCVPVFLDIDKKTHNIDVSKLNDALTKKTKVVMMAHSLGNPFNLDVIVDFCKKNNLWLIEDNCDALGSKYNGQFTGTFGHIGTLSFYPAHHITMGEGGAVFTNDPLLKKIMESFRDWGRDCYCLPGKDNTCGKRYEWSFESLPSGYDHKYVYSHLGFNLKITDMQAACGIAQLDKLEYFIQKRKDNFDYLKSRLSTCLEFIDLPEATENSSPSWFGFLVTLKNDNDFKRVDLLKYLNQEKIGTRLLFAGNLVKQPYMKDVNYRIVGNLDNTNYVMENSFWVGVYPGITNEMIDYVALKFETFFGLNF